MRFENDPFSARMPKTETFENASNRLLITMAFKVAIGAFLTAIHKGFVLKRGLKTPFRWSNVNAYRFHIVTYRFVSLAGLSVTMFALFYNCTRNV